MAVSSTSKKAEKDSAASSPGGKGGSSASSGGNMGSGSKSSAGAAAAATANAISNNIANQTRAAADAAKKAASDKAAKQAAANTAANAAAAAAQARAKAANTTAMGQRGLLGGTILSDPTPAASGLLGGPLKKDAQYGLGTRRTTPAQNFVDVFSKQNQGIGRNMNIDPRLAENLFDAVHAAQKRGMWQDNIFGSGLRSKEVQANIYADSFDKTGRKRYAAAPPGQSMHQFGLATDLTQGPIRDFVKSNLSQYGLENAVPSRPNYDIPHVQLAGSYANRFGIRANSPMATNANMGPTFNDAIRTATPGIGYQENPSRFASIAQPAPKMQDRLAAEIDPRSRALPQPRPAGLGVPRSIPSPMAGQGITGVNPNTLGPFEDVGVDRFARDPFAGAMPGYSSPMASVGNLPSLPDAVRGPARSPGGYDPLGSIRAPSAPPELPGEIPAPNMNMRGYRSPMEAVRGPPSPQSPNMDMGSYNSPMAFDASRMPKAPSDPSGGMSFNPSLPGRMPGPERSRSPGVTPEPQVAQGIPGQPGKQGPVQTAENPEPGGFFSGLGETVNPTPPKQVAELPKIAGPQWPEPGAPPLDITNNAPTIGPPPLDITNAPLKMPKNNLRQFTTGRLPTQRKEAPLPESYPGWLERGALTAPLGAMMPVPGAVSGFIAGTNYLDNEMRNGRLGNLRDLPGGQLAHSQPRDQAFDQSGAYQGDQRGSQIVVKGSGPNGEWTGKESPTQVAEMQQNVEQVLRGYFVDTGFQYPQYTTGFA